MTQHNTEASPDAAAEIADELRPLMFSIAYRMLGSVGDAEDVVQEAYLRYVRDAAEGRAVRSPRALLATITTRLAIDYLKSARVQRETYFGTWLPEPLLTSTEHDPAEITEMADSLSLTFLRLLETLSPVERAVFLLREVFDYGYGDIAEIVDKSEANCRQIFARARKRIHEGRPRFESTRQQQNELVSRFLDAVENGELDRLVEFLSADVAFYGDGGGKARALVRPALGQQRVNRILVSIARGYRDLTAQIRHVTANGGPALLAFDAEGKLINVLSFDIAGGAIQSIYSIINPDKIGRLGFQVSDLARWEHPSAE